MNATNNLHRQAMAIADDADAARRTGEEQAAQGLYEQAFDIERQAAELLQYDLTAEPSRSVLLRSAASLAMQCNKYREAERLIATALAGNPPDELCSELRDLLRNLHSVMLVSS